PTSPTPTEVVPACEVNSSRETYAPTVIESRAVPGIATRIEPSRCGGRNSVPADVQALKRPSWTYAPKSSNVQSPARTVEPIVAGRASLNRITSMCPEPLAESGSVCVTATHQTKSRHQTSLVVPGANSLTAAGMAAPSGS